jgi:hypothetical protein
MRVMLATIWLFDRMLLLIVSCVAPLITNPGRDIQVFILTVTSTLFIGTFEIDLFTFSLFHGVLMVLYIFNHPVNQSNTKNIYPSHHHTTHWSWSITKHATCLTTASVSIISKITSTPILSTVATCSFYSKYETLLLQLLLSTNIVLVGETAAT